MATGLSSNNGEMTSSPRISSFGAKNSSVSQAEFAELALRSQRAKIAQSSEPTANYRDNDATELAVNIDTVPIPEVSQITPTRNTNADIINANAIDDATQNPQTIINPSPETTQKVKLSSSQPTQTKDFTITQNSNDLPQSSSPIDSQAEQIGYTVNQSRPKVNYQMDVEGGSNTLYSNTLADNNKLRKKQVEEKIITSTNKIDSDKLDNSRDSRIFPVTIFSFLLSPLIGLSAFLKTLFTSQNILLSSLTNDEKKKYTVRELDYNVVKKIEKVNKKKGIETSVEHIVEAQKAAKAADIISDTLVSDTIASTKNPSQTTESTSANTSGNNGGNNGAASTEMSTLIDTIAQKELDDQLTPQINTNTPDVVLPTLSHTPQVQSYTEQIQFENPVVNMAPNAAQLVNTQLQPPQFQPTSQIPNPYHLNIMKQPNIEYANYQQPINNAAFPQDNQQFSAIQQNPQPSMQYAAQNIQQLPILQPATLQSVLPQHTHNNASISAPQFQSYANQQHSHPQELVGNALSTQQPNSQSIQLQNYQQPSESQGVAVSSAQSQSFITQQAAVAQPIVNQTFSQSVLATLNNTMPINQQPTLQTQPTTTFDQMMNSIGNLSKTNPRPRKNRQPATADLFADLDVIMSEISSSGNNINNSVNIMATNALSSINKSLESDSQKLAKKFNRAIQFQDGIASNGGGV